MRIHSRRAKLDGILDWLRFKADTFPALDYQPLPWMGLHKARRAVGTESRWEQIAPILERHRVNTMLDIGCNVGWFSINAVDMGISVLSLEIIPKNYRTLLFARNKLNLHNLGVLIMDLSPWNTMLLPSADATLFMSVWHHLVRAHSLEGASKVLRGIWHKTGRVLFFDTGEDEMPPKFNLPALEPEPKTWLTLYLQKNCPHAEVMHLGKHAAFTPDGLICKRNLFAITRLGRAK